MKTTKKENSQGAQTVKVKAPGLKHLRASIQYESGDGASQLLEIADGEAKLSPGGNGAQAVVKCQTRSDMDRLLRGEWSPIVAALQGKISVQGDRALALKVILGLKAGPPFAGENKAGGEAQTQARSQTQREAKGEAQS